MSDDEQNALKWQKRYEREKNARAQAEALLEEKSSQLYVANQQLEHKVNLESSKLKREEEKFTALFHYSKDGIILHTQDGIIINANQTICDLLGKPKESLIGKHIASVPTRDSFQICKEALQEIITHGNARFECNLMSIDLKRIPVDIAATSFQVGDQMIIQGIIRDVSASKESADKLEIATNLAIRANEAKSLFLATMSHEIRTPLNGIIGFTDLLLQSDVSSEQHQHLSLIKKSGDILLNVINDILDFSRIESGQIELEQVDFKLLESVEDVLDIHAQAAAVKKVDLLYSIDPELPQYIHGDSGRLKQILLNLVSNGLKFTNEGAVSIQVTKPNDGYIQLKVSDTGIGFDESITEQLFQPFQQEDASTTRKYGGTGLGLAICRQLAEAMGGNIIAKSKPGKGSQFIITLPFLLATSHHEINNSQISKLYGLRILVLDDNLINLDFMRARLKKWGCDAVTNDRPYEALAILEKSPDDFDLLLVDMLMPELDGFQFAEEIRKITSLDTPMLLITSSREVHKFQAAQVGYADVVYKPVKEKILLAAMLSTLEKKDLELDDDSASSRLKSGAPPPPSLSLRKKEKFALIVEDNQINAKLAKLIIERLGIIAHIAHNGKEALDTLTENSIYDIIFMDMQMPVMDGLVSTSHIRNNEKYLNYSKTPIIAMTANVLPEDEAKCIAAGMNEYITKPIDAEKIKEILEEYQIL